VPTSARPTPEQAIAAVDGASIAVYLGHGDASPHPYSATTNAWGPTGHTEIARWLVAEHRIGGWWAQSVTVAYERARGVRAKHERAAASTAP
jgi:hypothetical protein